MVDKNMRILVVDDFASVRRTITGFLNELGYNNIIEAEDGAEAFRVLQADSVDLVVSDWNMPYMTGFELLQKIRRDKQLKNTRFLMVTAEGDKRNIVAAVQARVDNYIVKPFTAKNIQEKISRIFGATAAL